MLKLNAAASIVAISSTHPLRVFMRVGRTGEEALSPQIDLLCAACILLDVPLPYLPVEFRIEKDSV